jgi:hypothetical protein
MYAIFFLTSFAIITGLIYFIFKKYDHKEALTIIAASFAVIVSLIASAAALAPAPDDVLQRPAATAIHLPRMRSLRPEILPTQASYNWIKVRNNEVFIDDAITKQISNKKSFWNLNAVVRNETDEVIGDIEIEISFKSCHFKFLHSKSCDNSYSRSFKQVSGINIQPHGKANIAGNFEIMPPNTNYRFEYKIIRMTNRKMIASNLDLTPTCGNCGDPDIVSY